MAVKLKAVELPQLLPWLQQHFPATFKIQNDLENHLKGKFPDLDFFVDQWPHPQAAIAVVDPKGQKLRCVRYYTDEIVGLFGVSSEALASVLEAAYETFSDWSRPKFCHGLAHSLFPILRPLMTKGFELTYTPSLVLKATPSDLTPIPVPDGMKISPVTDATVGIVNSTWKFSNESTHSYIQHLADHLPSVAMTTASGEHVGHMVGMLYGSMGMLYVMPRYRRQGYAKVIITQLAQKFFTEGEDAYVVILENNVSSINLHLSLGFKPLPDFRMSFMNISFAKN